MNQECEIENCHGLEIECGPDITEFCTEVYQLGDKCRNFASCEIINGECQLAENQQFEECKSCVEDCLQQFPDDGDKAFECESNC